MPDHHQIKYAMKKFNHYHFSLLSAIALLLAACESNSPPSIELSSSKADSSGSIDQSHITVLKNTAIYTVNSQLPKASAIAFDNNGEIIAVGEQVNLEADYPNAQHIDLQGKGAIVPGLIDAHAHLMNLGYSIITANLAGTQSKDDIIQRLQAKASELPAGSWLIGRGWDQNDWQNHDGSFPTAADLDQTFPVRPVWLTRIDGHAGWANSAAMQQLSNDQLHSDPEGGRIIRNQDGQASGVFIDAAMQLVGSLIPPPDRQTEQLALQRALEQTRQFGLTGVHEAGTPLQHLELYQEAIAKQQFPIRLYAMADGQGTTLAYLCENGLLKHPSGLLDARSVKFYLDGALGSRGASLVEPYSDEPGHYGLLFVEQDNFTQQVADAMRCGLQINTHAIGDNANQVLINAYEAAMQNVPEHSGRHRIEHAQVMLMEDFKRSAELNLIASVQPTHATSDMYWAEDRVGPDRIKYAYAWQDFIAAGTQLALGSDFPVESANPLLGFYAAVARQDVDAWPQNGWYNHQALTREQALHGFTLGAAYAAFMENEVGSLQPGKRADIVWLSRDIMQIPPAEIPQTTVLQTWLDGQSVYSQNLSSKN